MNLRSSCLLIIRENWARGLRVPRPDFLAMPFCQLFVILSGSHRGNAFSNSRGFLANWRNFKWTAHQGRHTKEMTNPLEFLQEVRAEGTKVRGLRARETLITTGLVIFMVLLASLFFVTVDRVLRFIVTGILSIGR